MRRALLACSLAALLSACGGGGSVVFSTGGFFLDVVGFSNGFTFRPVSRGQPLSAVIRPGDSIEFDAGAPASWTVSVNGAAAVPGGSTFVVNGMTIATTVLASGRISITTSVTAGAMPLPVTMVLTAVALADTRQAATITLQIR